MKAVKQVLVQLGGFMIFILAACTVPSAPPPLPTEIRISPLPTDMPLLETTPDPGVENEVTTPTTPANSTTLDTAPIQYFLEADLDYDAKALTVSQTINYTNNTNQTVTELPLLVPSAYQEGVFTLLALNLDPVYLETDAEMEDALLTLMLNPPLDPGQHIEIGLDFQLHLPQGGTALGYTDRQMLLADWYPFVPLFQEGIGWVINPPGQVGEHLVYPLSDFHLTLCLAPSRDELVVAASALPTETQGGCFQYRTKEKRNISLGISPYYQVSTIKSDLVTVTAYTFPEHAALGERATRLAVKAWATFTALIGENQRDHLSIVEADIFDGLETDGLIYLSEWYYRTADPSQQNYFELLIVHETAHQWFYGYIHNDQANEPWLDEALATYCEVLFYEIHHPNLVDWWWDYRVATYAPEGPVNATIYEFDQYRPYINAVYLRGASFLQDLRNQVGDQAFFQGLRQYTQFGGGPENLRTSDDFFEVFRQVTDQDLSLIIPEFFQ